MTGKEKKYQEVRKYELMYKVLKNHIDELEECLARNIPVEAECSAFRLAIKSWVESEENQLISAQMKELDAEITRFKNGTVTSVEFANFLTTNGKNFITDVAGEKSRLEHRIELCNLLKTMQKQGEPMPEVINIYKLAQYLVEC